MRGKAESYQSELNSTVDNYLQTGEIGALKEIVEANSNLPGPRANLEFAAAFGETIAKRAQSLAGQMRDLCSELVKLSPEEAPVGDPKEFIPFCGTLGLGVVGVAKDTFWDKALTSLKVLSRDERWRVREGGAYEPGKVVGSGSTRGF